MGGEEYRRRKRSLSLFQDSYSLESQLRHRRSNYLLTPGRYFQHSTNPVQFALLVKFSMALETCCCFCSNVMNRKGTMSFLKINALQFFLALQ